MATIDEVRELSKSAVHKGLEELERSEGFRFGLGTKLKLSLRDKPMVEGLLHDVGNRTVVLRTDNEAGQRAVNIGDIRSAHLILGERSEELPLQDGMTKWEAMVDALKAVNEAEDDEQLAGAKEKVKAALGRLESRS
jgi:hypothetical protein